MITKADGFIIVGCLGPMAMTKRGLRFAVRRGTVATVFPTRQSAALEVRLIHAERRKQSMVRIAMRIVRLIGLVGAHE